MNIPEHIHPYIAKIRHLEKGSHKGQNGKVLLIGGSELFHAASRWSLDVVSAMVDMVFYASVPENNDLIHEAKKEFWDGVVVPRGQVEAYLTESDVVLIGPGMTRDGETEHITNHLLSSYPEKKWVVDAGALQMVNPELLRAHMIVTPHQKEFERISNQTRATVLLKGQKDHVFNSHADEWVEGGNPGMTKGGTGDALAGLVAALYAYTDDPMAACVVASFVNKSAGDVLYETVGPFFKTSDLVQEIPKVLKVVLGY